MRNWHVFFFLLLFFFYILKPQPAGGIERSGCPCVRTSVRSSVDQVTIFVQGRSSR